MSQHHDDRDPAERALSRALHAEVDQMNDSPLGLDNVQDRARAVRRRRRVVAGAGLAVAVAVIVPTVVVATGGPDRDGAPGPATASGSATAPPSADPTPTATPSTDRPAGTAPFDVSDLPTGDAPAIDWSDGRDVHRADGTVVAGVLPGGVDAFAPMGSGWLVSTIDSGQGNAVVRSVSESGVVDDKTYLSEGGMVSSREGGAVAWAFTNEIYVAQAEGDEVLQLPSVDAPGGYAAVAVTSGDCSSTDAGCTVFVNTRGEQPQVWASVSTSDGFADRYDEGLQTMTAWSEAAYAGITEVKDDTSTCSAVRDPATLSSVWETCDHRLVGFSPGGTHLLGVGSIGDGFGDAQVAVLDAADGAVLADLVSDDDHQTTAVQMAWEDDEHALLVTYADGAWAVVRLGLDGSMEYAVAPRAGDQFERPFFLRS